MTIEQNYSTALYRGQYVVIVQSRLDRKQGTWQFLCEEIDGEAELGWIPQHQLSEIC